MKIYINSNYEIKSINSTTDESLTMYEADRDLVFGDKSDFMILNYCYKPTEHGYSVYPSIDYNILKLLDTQIISKLSLLEEENHVLRQELMLMKMEV